MRLIQDKYEEQLGIKEQEAEELRSQFKAAEERMQFEIVHLKTELEKQFKKCEGQWGQKEAVETAIKVL